MGVTLLETHADPLPGLLWLLVIGAVGFFAVRRWPRTLSGLLPILVIMAARPIARLVAFLTQQFPGEFALAIYADAALSASLILLAFGFPLLGAWQARRRRSRPAG